MMALSSLLRQVDEFLGIEDVVLKSFGVSEFSVYFRRLIQSSKDGIFIVLKVHQLCEVFVVLKGVKFG